MESNARFIVSASVVEQTATGRIIEITPGFEGAPWRMELFSRVADPMGPQKAAAYVTERYLIDHPGELQRSGREAITAAVYYAITPEAEWPAGAMIA